MKHWEPFVYKPVTEWRELGKELEKDWLEGLDNQEHLWKGLAKEALDLAMKDLYVNNCSGIIDAGTRFQWVQKEMEEGVKKI